MAMLEHHYTLEPRTANLSGRLSMEITISGLLRKCAMVQV